MDVANEARMLHVADVHQVVYMFWFMYDLGKYVSGRGHHVERKTQIENVKSKLHAQ